MTDILIVGTGALGTLFAARLAGARHRVTVLGTWREGIASLQKDGARLVDADGNEQRFEVRATDDPRECAGARYALVLVKAWQTERAARQLKECLVGDGLAVTIQNGLGNRETLALSLGPDRVALGVTTTGATLLHPGVARAGGEGVISLQRDQALGGVLSVSKDPIEAALLSAGFNVHVVRDALSLIWGKLVINAAINPLTALLKIPNGELLNRPSAREMMGRLAREVAVVAHAEKIHLPFEDPVAAAEDVAHRTAANQSSMLQDVLRGAPTEIDAICGAVVARGEAHGIETPFNRACRDLVHALSA
ncbi:MAG TPA: 2-dehydropantoate 2-reductase [Anaerolineales bacterium]|nr:2-dehydropantoate 2-reductase [Anaerolineales bacterium]